MNHPRRVCKIHGDSRRDTISSSFHSFVGKFDARISRGHEGITAEGKEENLSAEVAPMEALMT